MSKTLFIAVMAVGVSAAAYAGNLPEVGKRVYIIEKNSPKAVSIKADEDRAQDGEQVLRDPTMDTTSRPRKPVVQHKPVAKKPRPVAKRSAMAFKPAKINGNLRNPRVEFQRDYLKVGISEESYGTDFFQKIGDPLTDANF